MAAQAETGCKWEGWLPWSRAKCASLFSDCFPALQVGTLIVAALACLLIVPFLLLCPPFVHRHRSLPKRGSNSRFAASQAGSTFPGSVLASPVPSGMHHMGTGVDLGQPGFPTMHLFSANNGGKYRLPSVDIHVHELVFAY